MAEHFQCDPATLDEDQIRHYFLFLRQHKHYKAAPMKMAKYALLCFFVEHLKVSGWTVFGEVRVAEAQVLPVVLSRTEVHELLGAVREPRFAIRYVRIHRDGDRGRRSPNLRVVTRTNPNSWIAGPIKSLEMHNSEPPHAEGPEPWRLKLFAQVNSVLGALYIPVGISCLLLKRRYPGIGDIAAPIFSLAALSLAAGGRYWLWYRKTQVVRGTRRGQASE